MNSKTEKPTLFGYGLTTKAIAKKLGGGCTFFDDKCEKSYTDEMRNTIKPSSEFNPDKSNLEVTTPSLPPKHPLIQKAKNLLSEYDYFLSEQMVVSNEQVASSSEQLGVNSEQVASSNEQLASSSEQVVGSNEKRESSNSSLLPANCSLLTANSSLLTAPSSLLTKIPYTIWISGTNGKTTTTQMLTHLLEKRGAINGGNIGTPLADLDTKAPIWILETSSFTLHHTHRASPNIYLLLPITPDHLDWHGSPKAYEEDKLRPLLTMKEGELALVPKGLKLPKTDAFVVEYDSDEFLCDYFRLDASKLNYKGAFLQDALLALAITKVLFDEVDYELLNSFKRDAHRQEEFYDSKKRLWVNDSKATNLDATIQAIKGYSHKHIYLIIGGDDKGVDLTPLFEQMREAKLTLYTIGSNSSRLLELARAYNIEAKESKNIETAIKQIDSVLTLDDVALLSPAAASYDQFKSYIHRGESFMDLVKNI